VPHDKFTLSYCEVHIPDMKAMNDRQTTVLS